MAKDVALALSCGGARGLAQIGVIEELEAQGYHITSVAGSSMGALIGGIYATGRMGLFREWMKTIDFKKILGMTDISITLDHLVKGTRLIEVITQFIPDVYIEDLPISYCAIASDWKTGREVVIRSGSLFEAIRASISLPALYKPVRRDGMILIDGGVTNSFPLNRVERHKGDLLIGVDVCGHDYEGLSDYQTALAERRKRNTSLSKQILYKLTPKLDYNYYSTLSRAVSLMLQQSSTLMAEMTKPDLIISIKTTRYGGLDFNKSEKFIAIGHLKAQQALRNFRPE